MSTGALAIATLVFIPLIAHLLKRGDRKPIAFSLARLVPPSANYAARKSYFQDRALFAVRASVVLLLAVLGAAPLVRCSRPTLERQQGASVALAIILDDSASMRAKLPNGKERFAIAKSTALRLLAELREGDVATLVLAGKPARLLVSATPQLRVAEHLCTSASESDRSTDLDEAIGLAESSLRDLPQQDHRIALLSDLKQSIGKNHSDLWLPAPELAASANDCAIVSADQRGHQVEVTVACTNTATTNKRIVTLTQASAPDSSSAMPGPQSLPSTKQVQTVIFNQVPTGLAMTARLDGSDDAPSNDQAPVFDGISGTVIATVSDYTTARAATGGPPLIEQAFAALGDQLVVRPWSTLPEDERAYADVSLLILDDPSTFGPEMRTALMTWLARGGVAAAFLGARAIGAQLGMSLAPFVDSSATWSGVASQGFSARSLVWLGDATSSWSDIRARGRVELDQPLAPDTEARGRWQDDRIAITERRVGRGQAWTIGVPVSTSNSDLALRPAFLAFLNHLLETARHRGLSRVTAVGNPWKLDGQDAARVKGPDGNWLRASTPAALNTQEAWYEPSLSGIYSFVRNSSSEQRIARIEPDEITAPPTTALLSGRTFSATKASRVELSPYVAGLLTILVLLEVFIKSAAVLSPAVGRAFYRFRHRG
jgi:hypothetical protein